MNDLQTLSSASSGATTPSAQAVPAERGWQWLVSGWRLFRKAPAVWVGMAVVLLVAMALIGSVPLLGQFAIAFLMPVVAAGLLAAYRSLEQVGALSFADLFAGFRHHTGNLLVLGVLSLLGHAAIGLVVFAVGGGAMFSGVMSGTMLGAGPGALVALDGIMFALLVGTILLLPLAMALWFAPALVMFDDMAPLAALKASFIGCWKNTLPFLVYGVLSLILLVLALLPLLLGLLVLIPVLIGSVFASYVDIFGVVPVTSTATPTSAPGA